MHLAETAHVLRELLRGNAAAEPLVARLEASSERPGSPSHRAAYAGVPRRLGAAAAARVVAPAELVHCARVHWTLSDYARVYLVVTALARTPSDEQPGFVLALLEGGEIGEQESLLRTLTVLPESARYVETGLAACRTNARRVFEAIACENAFPVLYFPELGFNQMVLKAIFTEVPVQRIEGLGARVTPDLQRMVTAYASERRAAGRVVPDDVDRILNGKIGGVT